MLRQHVAKQPIPLLGWNFGQPPHAADCLPSEDPSHDLVIEHEGIGRGNLVLGAEVSAPLHGQVMPDKGLVFLPKGEDEDLGIDFPILLIPVVFCFEEVFHGIAPRFVVALIQVISR